MAEWVLNLTNTTGSEVTVEDIGIVFDASEVLAISDQFQYQEIAGSDDIKTLLNAGTLTLDTGGAALPAATAVNTLTRVHIAYLSANHYTKTEVDGLLGGGGTEIDNVEAALGAYIDVDGNFVSPSGTNFMDTATTFSELADALDTVTGTAFGSLGGFISNVDGSWVSPSGTTYIDTATDMSGALTALDTALNTVDVEHTAAQNAIGLSSTGLYVQPTSTNYLDATTTVMGALGALDTAAGNAQTTADNAATAAGNAQTAADNAQTTADSKVSKAGDTMTGALAMGTNKITSSYVPVAGDDLVNKLYCDSLAAGYDPKESCRLGSTANIDLATGGLLTIDGVQTVADDRVLVKDQTDATENGIYVVAAGAWTRSTDMDGTPAAEISGGGHTYVEAGTQAGSEFVIVWDGIITLDTDPINWTQSGGSSAFSALQTEVNNIESSLGTWFNADGTWTAPTGGATNYMDDTADLTAALIALDSQVAINEGAISTNASAIAALEASDITNINVVNGAVYGRDVGRSKWMGPREAYVLGRKGKLKKGYLQVTGGINSNNTGIRLERAMTLTSLAGQLDAVGTCVMHVRKNKSATDIATLNITAGEGAQDTALDIDFAAGDRLQVYLSATTAVEDPVVKLGMTWNGGSL